MKITKFQQIQINLGVNLASDLKYDYCKVIKIPNSVRDLYHEKPIYVAGLVNVIGKNNDGTEIIEGYINYTADFNDLKFITSRMVNDTNFCLMDLSFISKLPIREDVNSTFVLTALESGEFEIFTCYKFNRSGNVLFKEEHCQITCMVDIHRLINRINNALLHNFTLEI